ncbi:MAG: peptidylprolyl isomerase [Bifidobacteriaceae bacterium]|jgi:peptidyl-prolyl cis-trans isomerase B (cyclophilin B)|nr:peptidylprolyl isomerase [Bifidobacteriaceae bacterium]
MAKRNLRRERARRKALARQQRMIAKAKRRRRNQLIAGITVATLALAGVAAVVVTSILSGDDNTVAAEPADDTSADFTAAPTDPANSEPTDPVDSEPTEAVTPNPKATYTAVPDPALAEGREWAGSMATSVGDVGFTLDGAAAAQATANFVQLASDGYYDASSCHRLTTANIFVLQCGSLTGDGTDNPGYQFGPLENVPEDGVYPAGTIAMARASAEDSQGAQFFIVYAETTLPGGYSVFGHVTSGLELIEAVAAAGTVDGGTDGQPATTVTIDGIELQ